MPGPKNLRLAHLALGVDALDPYHRDCHHPLVTTMSSVKFAAVMALSVMSDLLTRSVQVISPAVSPYTSNLLVAVAVTVAVPLVLLPFFLLPLTPLAPFPPFITIHSAPNVPWTLSSVSTARRDASIS